MRACGKRMGLHQGSQPSPLSTAERSDMSYISLIDSHVKTININSVLDLELPTPSSGPGVHRKNVSMTFKTEQCCFIIRKSHACWTILFTGPVAFHSNSDRFTYKCIVLAKTPCDPLLQTPSLLCLITADLRI